MVLIDNDFAIVDVNRAAAEFLGRRKDELVGARSSRLVAPQDRAAWVHRWRVVRNGPPSRCEVSLLAPAGRRHLFEVTCAPNIGPSLHLAMLRDIDARRRAERFARFLDEASDILAGSLDCEATLATVARVAVPADRRLGCDRHGRRQTDCAASPSPTRIRGRRGRRCCSDRARRGSSADRGARMVHGRHARDLRRAGEDVDEDSRRSSPCFVRWGSCRRCACRSACRGRPVGAISLACSDARRRFRSEDLAFAKELAHRASAALENARTFRESQEANRVEGRVSRDDLPRAADAAQRHPRLDDDAAPQARRRRQEGPRHDRAQRPRPDAPDRGRARRLARGHGQAEDRARARSTSATYCAPRWRCVTPMAEGKAIALDVRLEGGALPPLAATRTDSSRRSGTCCTNAIKFTAKGGRVSVRSMRTRVAGVEVVVADTGRGIRRRLPSVRLRAIPAGRQLDDARRGRPGAGARDREAHRRAPRRDGERRIAAARVRHHVHHRAPGARSRGACGVLDARPLGEGVVGRVSLARRGGEGPGPLGRAGPRLRRRRRRVASCWPRSSPRRAPTTFTAANGGAALEAFPRIRAPRPGQRRRHAAHRRVRAHRAGPRDARGARAVRFPRSR